MRKIRINYLYIYAAYFQGDSIFDGRINAPHLIYEVYRNFLMAGICSVKSLNSKNPFW